MSESRDPAGDSTTTNNMGEVREAEHQGAAVKAALGANIGVAIAKLLAAFFTGSSAMLSESVHSIADCSNEIVLMVGVDVSPSARRTATIRSACIAPNILLRSSWPRCCSLSVDSSRRPRP